MATTKPCSDSANGKTRYSRRNFIPTWFSNSGLSGYSLRATNGMPRSSDSRRASASSVMRPRRVSRMSVCSWVSLASRLTRSASRPSILPFSTNRSSKGDRCIESLPPAARAFASTAVGLGFSVSSAIGVVPRYAVIPFSPFGPDYMPAQGIKIWQGDRKARRSRSQSTNTGQKRSPHARYRAGRPPS